MPRWVEPQRLMVVIVCLYLIATFNLTKFTVEVVLNHLEELNYVGPHCRNQSIEVSVLMIVHVGDVCSSHFNYPLVLWCSHVSNIVRPQTVQFDFGAWGVVYRNQS